MRFRLAAKLFAWFVVGTLASCSDDQPIPANPSVPDGSVTLDGDTVGIGARVTRAPEAGPGGAAGTDASIGSGGSTGTDVDGSPDVSLGSESGGEACACEGGACYGGVCCRGCWDGATCRAGTDPGACGLGGVSCLSCDDANACTADKCNADGTCGHDSLTGTTCATGVCVGDVCHCGSPGEPCCATGQACDGGQTCQNGHCGVCGAVGQACCATTTPCAVGGICNGSSVCEDCGGSGQLCCPGTVPCASGFNCDAANHCAPCGALSQACCVAGNPCGDNLTCAGGTCQCGGVGQACCDGTQCRDDGDRCNGAEACQGTCRHVSAVTCAALDQCHQVGTCDPATGACSNPSRTDGFACSDDNACTLGDTCQAGVCQSGTAKACATGQRCDTASGNCVCDATSCATGCCSSTLACQGGTADDACGGSGGACASCSSTQVCLNQACVTCGGPGQPCCHPDNSCSTGNRCNTGTSICQPCGGLGQVCCALGPECDAFGACMNNTQCMTKDVWVGAGFEDDISPFGAVLHWDGVTWSEKDIFDLFDVGPVFGSSAQDVWLTGHQATEGSGSVHFPAGFSSMPVVEILPGRGGLIWSSGPNDAWTAGTDFDNNEVAMHWDGASWTTTSQLGASSSLYGVWGNGPSDVWEVGSTANGRTTPVGVLLHWVNGYSTTTGITEGIVPAVSSLYSIWGSGTNDLWASGQAGVVGAVAHFDTGVWSGEAITGTTSLAGVWGTGPNDVWLVGNNGSVGRAVHMTSFSDTSNVMTVTNTTQLNAVWAAAPNDVWAVADLPTGEGVVVHWDGTAWSNLQTFPGHLGGIWGVNH